MNQNLEDSGASHAGHNGHNGHAMPPAPADAVLPANPTDDIAVNIADHPAEQAVLEEFFNYKPEATTAQRQAGVSELVELQRRENVTRAHYTHAWRKATSPLQRLTFQNPLEPKKPSFKAQMKALKAEDRAAEGPKQNLLERAKTGISSIAAATRQKIAEAYSGAIAKGAAGFAKVFSAPQSVGGSDRPAGEFRVFQGGSPDGGSGNDNSGRKPPSGFTPYFKSMGKAAGLAALVYSGFFFNEYLHNRSGSTDSHPDAGLPALTVSAAAAPTPPEIDAKPVSEASDAGALAAIPSVQPTVSAPTDNKKPEAPHSAPTAKSKAPQSKAGAAKAKAAPEKPVASAAPTKPSVPPAGPSANPDKAKPVPPAPVKVASKEAPHEGKKVRSHGSIAKAAIGVSPEKPMPVAAETPKAGTKPAKKSPMARMIDKVLGRIGEKGAQLPPLESSGDKKSPAAADPDHEKKLQALAQIDFLTQKNLLSSRADKLLTITVQVHALNSKTAGAEETNFNYTAPVKEAVGAVRKLIQEAETAEMLQVAQAAFELTHEVLAAEHERAIEARRKYLIEYNKIGAGMKLQNLHRQFLQPGKFAAPSFDFQYEANIIRLRQIIARPDTTSLDDAANDAVFISGF